MTEDCNSLTEKKQPKREFTGIWIPKEIWENNRLTPFEKCLLSQIYELSGKEGCDASNSYFSKLFKTSERTIQTCLASLKRKGLIFVNRFDGRKRFLKCSFKQNFLGDGICQL